MTSVKRQLLPTVIATAAAYLVYENFFGVTPGPIVETLSGKVRGVLTTSREGKDYYQFLGIPYAEPPVGPLRFEDPKPVTPWGGVLNAYNFGAECLQVEVLILNRVIGTENCLSLNVFTPQVGNAQKPLPVFVYIHGGLFMGGASTMYKGKYFMDEGVVLVTMNYRVAALGFMASGDGSVRGNQGLKDQNLALQWINKNIRNFGGDTSRITLFGESAGGASVHYQMMASQSRGLFQKAISMSGTAIRKYTTADSQEDQLRDFGHKFGCDAPTSKDIIQCLKSVDGTRMVEVHRDASDALPKNKNALFVPVVETVNDTKAFIAGNPRQLIQQGKFNRMPWMTGVVAYEGLLYVGRIVREPEAIRAVNQNWREVFPKLLKLDPKKTSVVEKVKQFYFGDGDTLDILNNIERFSDLFSDRLFIHPTFQAAKLQSKYAPVYLYYLSYKPKTSVYQLITSVTPNGILPPALEYGMSLVKRKIQSDILGLHVPSYGPAHGDELSLLFDLHFLSRVPQGHPDYHLSKAMVKLWTSFAKETTIAYNGIIWPVVNPEDTIPSFLEINVEGKSHINPGDTDLVRRLKFWDSLNEPFW